MASKNKTESLRALGCEKLLHHSDGPTFFHFQKAKGNLFFNAMDGDFSEDNFVTKIFMKTCSILLNDSPEKTLFIAPFTVGQETLISRTELLYRHLSKPYLEADKQDLTLQRAILS